MQASNIANTRTDDENLSGGSESKRSSFNFNKHTYSAKKNYGHTAIFPNGVFPIEKARK